MANPDPNRFFIIAGPTAVGKSELAVAVAERCGGEIVSADAFQIYAGLDLLTAKPSPALRARVPHHLIGEVPLTRSFDVAQYLALALASGRIGEIRERGRIPIVVGGTGMYVRALTHGLADLPSADAALRGQLETQTTDDLCAQLAERDPAACAQIDRKNRRRVIRALEVCLLTGQPFSSFREQWQAAPRARGVVLQRDRSELHERINQRTHEMFAEGVVEEVRAAGTVGPTARQTLGWREIQAMLAGTLSREACITVIQQATRQYAKRQMTWFRRESHLGAIELAGTSAPDSLIETLAEQARAVE
jgi:tRNA dimethylallyltransferase